ncbi:MAG: DUF1624 domain-containing protein [Oscillospiraceae bacterium]|nr:DUF1624 domain-containing protein [Oscillospiraceae bacterium]
MKRVGLLDEIRGFAIICMVIYHVMFDLNSIYGVNVPIFFESWFDVVRNIFAGTFIFISGSVCNFSRNNIKRGAQCFFLGMLITFIVAFAQPEYPIYFGILHLLGISMMIYGLTEPFFKAFPPFFGILVFGVLFFALYNIPRGYIGYDGVYAIDMPRKLYDVGVLFPLGFVKSGAKFGDYFPLLPWFCMFAAGGFFGVYAKENCLPRFFYNTRVPFLAAAGRYTIWIYLLHQPIAMAILNLIFN